MLKRFFAVFAVTFGFASAVVAAQSATIGAATVSAPKGWRELEKSEDQIVFRSQDDRQQATFSVMRFKAAPSFEDFKRLCTLRLKAEKKGAPDAFFEPDAPEPYEKEGRYGLLFSGGEKKAGRMFSCYLSLSKTELVTIYVEAVGISPKVHLASFEAFVTSLKRE